MAVTFSLTLQACSPELPTLTKKGSKKYVSCEYSEKVTNLPGKGLGWGIYYLEYMHFQDNHFIHFSEDIRKNPYLRVWKSYQKNIFRRVIF